MNESTTGKMTWMLIGLWIVAMIVSIIVVKYPDVTNSIFNYIKNMIDASSKLIENNVHYLTYY